MLMQFKITLRCLDDRPVLPINYQYALSAWIYRVIQNADVEYAAFLHQRGYNTGRKSFKLFCFSQLSIPRRTIDGDRLLIQSREISFIIGFFIDRAAEEFIRGLFSEQHFSLGDRISRVQLVVQSVELRPLPLLAGNQPVLIRSLSPVVVARKRADNLPDEYLHPDDPDFGKLLFINLLDKYAAATGQAPPSWWDVERFRFRPVGVPPKSKLITIKSGTTAQTRVKGWLFDFEVDAPKELLETGLLAGWGRMNGEGFGCGEIAPARRMTSDQVHRSTALK